MSTVDAFNLFEVYLWSIMGIGFLISAIIRPANRWSALAAGIMLILFGISDWVELSTGAWWKPWWLFAWKAVCVVSLVSLAVVAYRKQKSTVNNDNSTNSRLTEKSSSTNGRHPSHEPHAPQ